MKLIEEYGFYLKVERSLSPNTVAAYVRDVSFFLESMKGKDVRNINSEDIISYFKEQEFNSERSQARALSSLKSFYGWLISEGICESNPCDKVEAPKLGRHLPEILSVEEIDSMIESTGCNSWNELRDKAILEVLYGCGTRVSEAVELKVSDIFFKEGFIRVIGKGNKQRIIPLGDSASNAIKDYIPLRPEPAGKEYEDCLFLNKNGKKLSRISIFNMVKRQAMAAGIHKEISPHTLRHCFATHLIENGADLRVVQQMLGHESILTTEIYTHIDSSTWQAEIISHHPRK